LEAPKVIEGKDVYPVPGLVIVRVVTWAEIAAVAAAPEPVVSPVALVNPTVGTEEKPLPKLVRVNPVTEAEIAAVAVAPLPPPPVNVTLGDEE